jgi:hypothetical protein
MTQDRSEPTGDLGYDLVHEETAAAPRSSPPPQPGPPPSTGPDEDAGDLAYDEAHDFRSR